MLIANPIYDVVFKRLMENEKVAKFFVATLLAQEVVDITVKPQEYTYAGELETAEGRQAVENRIRDRFLIWVYRLDFVATIKTASGDYQKVLIEIQKAKHQIDLMRFRNYLAEQYKKEDTIGEDKMALPITTIYLLGFQLPDITSACLKVARQYQDLITQTVIDSKSEFIEQLTHDCYVVQLTRIADRYHTRLDKLLCVFAQQHFTDDKEITKQFTHAPDIEEIKTMTDILHYIGTDPAERKLIEKEQEAIRTINAMFEQKERKYQKALAEQNKELALQKKELDEKDKELTEKDKELTEKDKLIQELLKKLNEQK
jgi:hypothetical protein